MSRAYHDRENNLTTANDDPSIRPEGAHRETCKSGVIALAPIGARCISIFQNGSASVLISFEHGARHLEVGHNQAYSESPPELVLHIRLL
jgi:hypothetical protein